MTTTLIPRNDVLTEPLTAAQDDLVRAAVAASLRSSGYLLLRDLHCEVADGVVTISGRVPSFHLKQVAQSVLMKVEAVRAVNNRVEVG